MRPLPYVRWTIIGLFVGATVINYLTCNVLGMAAPTILAEQRISSERYSWITGAFPVGVMFQPLYGYVLDPVGRKLRFSMFVGARGLAAYDMAGTAMPADFAWFRHAERADGA